MELAVAIALAALVVFVVVDAVARRAPRTPRITSTQKIVIDLTKRR